MSNVKILRTSPVIWVALAVLGTITVFTGQKSALLSLRQWNVIKSSVNISFIRFSSSQIKYRLVRTTVTVLTCEAAFPKPFQRYLKTIIIANGAAATLKPAICYELIVEFNVYSEIDIKPS